MARTLPLSQKRGLAAKIAGNGFHVPESGSLRRDAFSRYLCPGAPKHGPALRHVQFQPAIRHNPGRNSQESTIRLRRGRT